MGMVLQILGVVFVIFCIGFVLIWFLIRRKLQAMGTMLKNVTSGMQPVSRITMKPDGKVSWTDQDTVQEAKTEMARLGFEHAGDFSIPEIAGLHVSGHIHPASHLLGIIYDHEFIGVWQDFVAIFEDATSLTVSNSSQGGKLSSMPGRQKLYLKEAGISDLFEAAGNQLAGRPEQHPPIRIITADRFALEFEEAYAEEMAWRAARGGPTKDDIRRVAEDMDGEFSEDMISAAKGILQQEAEESIQTACIDQFLKDSAIPAAEWVKFEDRVIAVHDGMTAKAVADAVFYYTDVPDGFETDIDAAANSNLSAFQIFHQINGMLPETRRFILLGEVSGPVHAHIYGLERIED